MAYDEDLADRLRELLADRGDVIEKKMFGGLAFMVAGHMTVCATRADDGADALMVRIDPSRAEELLTDPAAEPVRMRGRPLAGWLRVGVDARTSDAALARWVRIGTDFTATLPPKPDLGRA